MIYHYTIGHICVNENSVYAQVLHGVIAAARARGGLGALMFIHQGGATLVRQRADRYHLPNTIGNLVDRAVTFASLVFGGVMDACPQLKICLAHGGGYTCFGIGRMDQGWQVRAEARIYIAKPPSAYLRKFYYDCLTHSEAALRFLLDTVGADRVVFGTDWPADMRIDWPVAWVLDLQSLTREEKELILWKNLERLLGLQRLEMFHNPGGSRSRRVSAAKATSPRRSQPAAENLTMS